MLPVFGHLVVCSVVCGVVCLVCFVLEKHGTMFGDESDGVDGASSGGCSE